jgi:hypothetical protein
MTSSHKVIVVGAATPSAVVIADGSPMYAWITAETAPPCAAGDGHPPERARVDAAEDGSQSEEHGGEPGEDEIERTEQREVDRILRLERGQRRLTCTGRGSVPRLGEMLRREAVEGNQDDSPGGPDDGSSEPEPRQRAGQSAADRVVDRDETAQHQDERHEDPEVHGNPDPAGGDHPRCRLGMTGPRRHRVDQIPGHAKDGPRERRDAAEPGHPPVDRSLESEAIDETCSCSFIAFPPGART